MKTLKDPEPAIRTAAVSALGDFGQGTHTMLIGRFLKDDAVIVRVAAAEALGKIGDVRAISMLDAALNDPSNQYRGASLWVRAHYTIALGNIGDAKAYPVLLKCLADGDARVVQSAVVALEKIAGFSLGDGRSSAEEVEAWSRWDPKPAAIVGPIAEVPDSNRRRDEVQGSYGLLSTAAVMWRFPSLVSTVAIITW